MTKQITLNQIGYRIKGEAILNLWGGGAGSIPMQSKDIVELTTENVIRSINDNGFGCESFAGAEVDIYTLYERDVEEYLMSLSFTQEDLIGCTSASTDYEKLTEDYEKRLGITSLKDKEKEILETK